MGCSYKIIIIEIKSDKRAQTMGYHIATKYAETYMKLSGSKGCLLIIPFRDRYIYSDAIVSRSPVLDMSNMFNSLVKFWQVMYH